MMKWKGFEGKPGTGDFAKETVDHAREELIKIRDDLLRHEEVYALDVGYRMERDKVVVDGKTKHGEAKVLKELAIRVHLHPKLSPEKLADEDKADLKDLYEKRVDVPLDIVDAQYGPSWTQPDHIEVAEVNRRERVEPLIGGVTIGGQHGRGGTLGAVVWDKRDGSLCILSNWHAIAGTEARKGDACIQPALFDGGIAAQDRIGILKRWCIDEHADAALAELTHERPYCSGDILGEGKIVRVKGIKGLSRNHLGLRVVKYGRTTGKTVGIIDGVGMSIGLNFDGHTQTLHDQIRIVPVPDEKVVLNESAPGNPAENVTYWFSRGEVSQSGDSGAVWLDESGNAVGLHFAGDKANSPVGEFAVANCMEVVAEKLEFDFVTPYFCSHPGDVGLGTGEVGSAGIDRALRSLLGNGAVAGQPVPIDVGGEQLARALVARVANELRRSAAAEPVPIDVGG